MVWGGLRGAVGLALALSMRDMVRQAKSLCRLLVEASDTCKPGCIDHLARPEAKHDVLLCQTPVLIPRK